jgi:hypothetical protein
MILILILQPFAPGIPLLPSARRCPCYMPLLHLVHAPDTSTPYDTDTATLRARHSVATIRASLPDTPLLPSAHRFPCYMPLLHLVHAPDTTTRTRRLLPTPRHPRLHRHIPHVRNIRCNYRAPYFPLQLPSTTQIRYAVPHACLSPRAPLATTRLHPSLVFAAHTLSLTPRNTDTSSRSRASFPCVAPAIAIPEIQIRK